MHSKAPTSGTMTDTIPRLLTNTGCQDMLAIGDVTHSGWLRKRTRFHRRFSHFSFVTKLIPWFQKYVVLTKGCAYIYKNENSTAPSEAFILLNFSRVQRAVEFRHSVVPWAFRVEHRTQDSKFRYFSCSSQHEMKLWMIQFKKEMYTANVPELMSRRTKIAELERAKTKLADSIDSGDSDLDSGLYVYIESELSAEGAIQRTSSLTSVYDGDRCSTQPPEPPTRPMIPTKPNVRAKPRNHHEDASDPTANTTVKSLGSDECHLYDDPNEDVPYDDCGNVARSLWNDALWIGSKEAGDRCIRDQTGEGVYLIRYRDDAQQTVLLVHRHTRKLCKFKIEKTEDDQLYLRDGEEFKTGEELLVFYKCHNLPGIPTRLTNSYRHA